MTQCVNLRCVASAISGVASTYIVWKPDNLEDWQDCKKYERNYRKIEESIN